MDPFERLVASADRELAGIDVNRVLWETRSQLEAEHGRAIVYEIVLKEDAPDAWNSFVHSQLLKLADHLRAKRSAIPGGPEVLILVWRGEHAYTFDGPHFWGAAAEIAGTSVGALKADLEARRAERDGEPASTAGAAPSRQTLALAPPPSDGGTDDDEPPGGAA